MIYDWIREVGCALTAAFCVSPIVSILDKAMVKEISGISQFMKEVKLSCNQIIHRPRMFFRGMSFQLTFAVYAGTYISANLSESKEMKIATTSATNVSLLAWRDSIFAKTYSNSIRRPIPLRTLSLFAFRDTVTMTATFGGAPLASSYFGDSEVSKISSSLIVPTLGQWITAPAHIYALDYYNNPNSKYRYSHIRKEYMKIAMARSLRILPAFGLGSYLNEKLRHISYK